VLQCGYAESKRIVLRRILNVLTDGAVWQFSGREFQSLGAATEKRRARDKILFQYQLNRPNATTQLSNSSIQLITFSYRYKLL